VEGVAAGVGFDSLMGDGRWAMGDGRRAMASVTPVKSTNDVSEATWFLSSVADRPSPIAGPY